MNNMLNPKGNWTPLFLLYLAMSILAVMLQLGCCMSCGGDDSTDPTTENPNSSNTTNATSNIETPTVNSTCTCGSWSACSGGSQSRTCSPSGCTPSDGNGTVQTCTTPPTPTPNCTCDSWSVCSGGSKYRSCSPSGCTPSDGNGTVQTCTTPTTTTTSIPTITVSGISDITVNENAPGTATGPSGLTATNDLFSLDLTNYVSGNTTGIVWDVFYVDPTKLTVSISGNTVTFYLIENAVGTDYITFRAQNSYGISSTDSMKVIIIPNVTSTSTSITVDFSSLNPIHLPLLSARAINLNSYFTDPLGGNPTEWTHEPPFSDCFDFNPYNRILGGSVTLVSHNATCSETFTFTAYGTGGRTAQDTIEVIVG